MRKYQRIMHQQYAVSSANKLGDFLSDILNMQCCGAHEKRTATRADNFIVTVARWIINTQNLIW
jgi:hypothetical protein